MQIVVIAESELQNEFENKGVGENVQVHFVTNIESAPPAADAWFYLLNEDALQQDSYRLNIEIPVFVNAVISTSDKLAANCIRLNAWPGFLMRNTLEIAGAKEKNGTKVLDAMGWKYQDVPDIAGMITPRVISMIVNEAYFALQDDVSTKAEIDTAMKLGTNYPFGPFEWSEKIGLKMIYNLLTHMADTDKRYLPSPALVKEINS